MPTVKSQIEDLYHKLQLVNQQITPAGTVTDQGVTLDVIGAATYTNLHQWLNNTCSAMRITGGLISDSGGGQIDVAAGKGILKTIDDPIGENRQFDWGAEFNLALADNDTSWVGIEYNAGFPKVKINTNLGNFNFRTDFILGRVYRAGATVMILNAGSYYDNFQHRVCYRIFEVDGFRRATGGIIGNVGLLDFSISDGSWYCGTTRFTTAAWDCSGADTFTYWHRDGGGGWTTVAAQADINNLNYDDGVPPLGVLGAGRFGVHWVYLAHDGSVHVQYGQGNYKHFEAEAALVPDGPDFFAANCVLIGKIIVGQADPTFTDVLSAFTTIFIGQAASDHEELSGLLGGAASDHYHLKAVEWGYVSGLFAQSVLKNASPMFAQLGLVDTGADDELYLKCNEDLTADRILNLVVGDAVRTITLQGNPTLNDWFDQSVKQAVSPTFAGLTVKGAAAISQIYMKDSDGNIDGRVYATGGMIGFVDADGQWAVRAENNVDVQLKVNNLLGFTLGADLHIDIYDWDDSVTREISFGADDSGGAGFKLLRVPN